MEKYINGTAAKLAKPGVVETRPDLNASFRLERGDQFVIGFQLGFGFAQDSLQIDLVKPDVLNRTEFFKERNQSLYAGTGKGFVNLLTYKK